MALFINGVGQDSFSMNGVSIDNLYVDDVLVWSLDTGVAPDAPTNFVASDDNIGQITFTWDDSTVGNPTPTYDIRVDGGDVLVSGVTSPHIESMPPGTADYLVRAINSEGTADSNVDSGTALGIDEPLPIYNLTEALIDWGGFNWLVNSAAGATTYNAKLLQSNGVDAWYPTAQEYPRDGTIDFGTNYADTEWTPPTNIEYTFTFIENVDMGTSYDMVSINAKGDGSTADVLYDGVLNVADTGLNYTPPLDSIKLKENMIFTDIPAIPVCTITMSQYTFGAGDTATVTLTFNVEIGHLGLSSIVSADNGSLSTFTETPDKPWEYTATFTPDEGVNDDTNVITFTGNTGGVWDNWNNTSNADAQSANYTVSAGTVELGEWYLSVGATATTPAPVGIYIHEQTSSDDTWRELPDKDSVEGRIEYRCSGAVTPSTSGVITSDDSGALYDKQLENYWWQDANQFYSHVRFKEIGTYILRLSMTTSSTNAANELLYFTISLSAGDASWVGNTAIVVNARTLDPSEYAQWEITTTQINTEISIKHGETSPVRRGGSAGLWIKEQ